MESLHVALAAAVGFTTAVWLGGGDTRAVGVAAAVSFALVAVVQGQQQVNDDPTPPNHTPATKKPAVAAVAVTSLTSSTADTRGEDSQFKVRAKGLGRRGAMKIKKTVIKTPRTPTITESEAVKALEEAEQAAQLAEAMEEFDELQMWSTGYRENAHEHLHQQLSPQASSGLAALGAHKGGDGAAVDKAAEIEGAAVAAEATVAAAVAAVVGVAVVAEADTTAAAAAAAAAAAKAAALQRKRDRADRMANKVRAKLAAERVRQEAAAATVASTATFAAAAAVVVVAGEESDGEVPELEEVDLDTGTVICPQLPLPTPARTSTPPPTTIAARMPINRKIVIEDIDLSFAR
jgi:hypothetical protein